MRRRLILNTCLFGLFLSACAYQPDVQQGNALDDADIKKLKVGMSKQQVKFVLGTALLKDPFHQDRWDYIYTLRKGTSATTRKLLTLYFDKSTLKKIDDQYWHETTLQIEAN